MDIDSWAMGRYQTQNKASSGPTLRAIWYVDASVAPTLMSAQSNNLALLEATSHPHQLEIESEIYFHPLEAHPFVANLRNKSPVMTSIFFPSGVVELSLANHYRGSRLDRCPMKCFRGAREDGLLE